MNWSNDMVLEFLLYYEDETIIWNPRNDNHKKKHLVKDAWRRIKSNISWKCSLDELIKKKDSLMAYYRMHLRKIKKSRTGVEDHWSTNWFAFKTMDNFLRPIYDCTTNKNKNICSENEAYSNNNYLPVEVVYCEKIDDDTEQTSTPSPPHILEQYRLQIKRKKLNVTQERSVAKQQTKEAFEIKRNIKKNPLAPKVLNEFKLFGNLVASKIQKIQNPLEREILMNDINKLIFQALHSSITSHQMSVHQNNCMIMHDGTIKDEENTSDAQEKCERKYVITDNGNPIDAEVSTPDAQNFVIVE